jgi:protein arginine phosphatase
VTEEAVQPRTFKDIVRKFIPQFLLQQRGIIRRLGSGAGRIYAGLRMRDVLGMRAENQRAVPPSTRSFVFVCFGNIMRSAMAEFLMRKVLNERAAEKVEEIRIVSAGLHANPGREAHPWMQEAGTDLGISLATHRAKLLTREMVDAADAIFAMDFQNKAELLTLYPDAADKIHMLSSYAEGAWKCREIPDPYLGDLEVTRYCARQLQTCIQNLLAATVFSSAKQASATSYEEPLART